MKLRPIPKAPAVPHLSLRKPDLSRQKPELKPAKLTPAARIEGKMLTIDVPAGREGLENYAEFTLDLGQYASCHLIGTIRGKFTGFRPDQDR